MALVALSLIIPTILTVLIPVMLLFWAQSKNMNLAFKEAFDLAVVAAAVFTAFFFISSLMGYLFVIVGGFSIIWTAIVVGLTAVAYVINQLIKKRPVRLDDKKMWLVLAVVAAAEYVLPLIGLSQYTMSLI